MKRIYVEIEEEELERLKEIAIENNTTPGVLLSSFVADLTHSDRRGGSDESWRADDWLERNIHRWG